MIKRKNLLPTVAMALLCTYVTPPADAGHINPGFEDTGTTEVAAGEFKFVDRIPGWQTTDTAFETWGTGFLGVDAHEGQRFAELNASKEGVLFQDSRGIEKGDILSFTFAHGGRNGDDTITASSGVRIRFPLVIDRK